MSGPVIFGAGEKETETTLDKGKVRDGERKRKVDKWITL